MTDRLPPQFGGAGVAKRGWQLVVPPHSVSWIDRKGAGVEEPRQRPPAPFVVIHVLAGLLRGVGTTIWEGLKDGFQSLTSGDDLDESVELDA
jgi:hypothetical protein